MAESYTQDTDTIYGTNSGRGAGGRTRRIWLWLLLLVLIVVLFTYDQGAMKGYGEKAYSRTETFMGKVSRRAKELYACGLTGCKSTPAISAPTAAVGGEPSKSGEAASATQDTQADPARTDDNDSAQQPAGADLSVGSVAMPASGGQMADGQSQANESSYPAYPAYPAYPPYPPYSAFGHGGSESASSEQAVDQSASTQPLQAPLPARPPKPEAAPGKPAYPDYPVYPPVVQYAPPVVPAAPVAPQSQLPRPPQLLPVPSVTRPGQRPNQAPDADGLVPARQAAAAGRFPESVREYSQYLTNHPNDGNAYGELGNVYLKIGRFPEAAQNYYEAANRLVDAGYHDAVTPLMPIIERYEPMLAALIKEKIAHSRRGYTR